MTGPENHMHSHLCKHVPVAINTPLALTCCSHELTDQHPVPYGTRLISEPLSSISTPTAAADPRHSSSFFFGHLPTSFGSPLLQQILVISSSLIETTLDFLGG